MLGEKVKSQAIKKQKQRHEKSAPVHVSLPGERWAKHNTAAPHGPLFQLRATAIILTSRSDAIPNDMVGPHLNGFEDSTGTGAVVLTALSVVALAARPMDFPQAEGWISWVTVKSPRQDAVTGGIT